MEHPEISSGGAAGLGLDLLLLLGCDSQRGPRPECSPQEGPGCS